MYEKLNEQQKQAVFSKSRATLVVAGAGSGKTRVITTRVNYLIKDLTQEPSSIVSLTFTNKAAGEMKERLEQAIPELDKPPFIGTFHSFCLYTMRSNPHFFGTSFAILDDQDQLQLITRLIKQHGLEKDLNSRKVLGAISRYKNSSEQDKEVARSPLFRDIYQKYEQEKGNNDCLDFDDLILRVCSMLQSSPEFGQHMRSKIKHILIDEYQDTSTVQHELVKRLSFDDKGKLVAQTIFAVGDQDQSIYSWRGAQVTNMDSFAKEFSDSQIFKLERNYRSVQPILQLANDIISYNQNRLEKHLWTDQAASHRIFVVDTYDEYREAELIAATAKHFQTLVQNGQLAILIRAHMQSRVLEEKMIELAVPYKIVGSVKFYDRREIRDCLALLRLCSNPADKQSFLRVAGFAVKGLGDSFCSNLFEFMDQSGTLNIIQALDRVKDEQPFKINKNHVAAIDRLGTFFVGLDAHSAPFNALEQLIERAEYWNFLERTYSSQEADARCQNVTELLRSAQRYEEKVDDQAHRGSPLYTSSTVEGYLHEVALIQNQDDMEGQDPVLIMTMHTAKGLEFDNVIIPGVEEGIIPYKRANDDHSQAEEECRLFYVGITRAKKRLILTKAASRNHYGKRMNCQPSRFIDNINKELVDTVYSHNPSSTGKMLGLWLSGQTVSSSSGDLMNKSIYSSFIPAKAQEPQKNDQKSKTLVKPATKTRSFRKGTLVRHDKFGLGVVHAAKKQADGQLCLTVAFGKDHKKVLSRFLQTVRP